MPAKPHFLHHLSRLIFILNLLLLAKLLPQVQSEFSSSIEEQKLAKHLFRTLTKFSPHSNMYNNSIYPLLDLYQIIDVDERNSELTTKIWLQIHYFVDVAAWDPDNYKGTDRMTFPPLTFWTPDIGATIMYDQRNKLESPSPPSRQK